MNIKNMWKNYIKLSKMGIVLFALLSAGAGYILAYLQTPEAVLSGSLSGPFLWLLAGLYLVICGSFALNQSMEWHLDSLMKRTQRRPIVTGQISTRQAFLLAFVQIIIGLSILFFLNPLTWFLTLTAVFLYNICYTISWKKNWVFAAVPGALPGALPVMIGYSVYSAHIFSIECLYLFFLVFLWQMPHFWSLAMHYKHDYKAAGIPALPVCLGDKKTLYYMSMYLLSYLGLVLVSPLFLPISVLYVMCLIPFCLKIFIEFLRFSKTLNWKPFFLWLNLSVLIFLWAPVCDIFLFSLLG